MAPEEDSSLHRVTLTALLEPVAHFELLRNPTLLESGFYYRMQTRHGAEYTHLRLGDGQPAVLVRLSSLPHTFARYRDAQNGWPHFRLRRVGPWSTFRRFFSSRLRLPEPAEFDAGFILQGEDAAHLGQALTMPVRESLVAADLDPDLAIEVDGPWLLVKAMGPLRDRHRLTVVREMHKVVDALMLAS